MNLADQTVAQLVESLAARTSTPGGGAVASLTAALAAALGGMVVNYSVGKKKLAAHDELHRDALRRLADHAGAALDLARADAEAYARLNALWKLDPDDEQRQAGFASAVRAAIDAPARVMTLADALLELLEALAGKTNAMLASDLAIAAVLAEAAARSAAWNVRVNLPLVEGATEADRLRHAAQTLEASCRTRCAAIEQACA